MVPYGGQAPGALRVSDGTIFALTIAVGICAAVLVACIYVGPKLESRRERRRNQAYWDGLATPYGVAPKPDRRWVKMLLDTRRTTVGLLVIRRAK
jgi:hypothetical protein